MSQNRTGAEHYLESRLDDPEYRQAYEGAIARLEETRAKMDRAWTVFTHSFAFVCGVLFALSFLILVAVVS